MIEVPEDIYSDVIKPLSTAPETEYLISEKFFADIQEFRRYDYRKTGFSNLDDLGSFYSGLYVLGATPSLGKTTFVNQLADNLAWYITQGEPVLLFTFEQSRFELTCKSLSRLMVQMNDDIQTRFSKALTSIKIRRGEGGDGGEKKITPDLERALMFYKKMAERKSIIECNFDTTYRVIEATVRDYMKNHTNEKPVIIIDYLQAIATEANSRITTKDAVDLNMRALKNLQREFNIVIVVISSINRANYLTPIDYESFKESGSIEYTADVVWGMQLEIISREKAFEEAQNKEIKKKRELISEALSASPRKIELKILKNRFGKKGISLFFDYYPAYELFLSRKEPEAKTKKERGY